MTVLDRSGIMCQFPGFVPGQAPQDLVVFYDDFLGASWSTADAERWLATAAGDGATNSIMDVGDPTTLQYYGGGILSVVTGATVADGHNFQVNGEHFSVGRSGYPIYFEARFATLDVSNCEIFVGLAITDTEIITGGVSDRVGFELITGILACMSEKSGVEKSTSIAITETDAKFIRVAFFYDGDDTLTFYVDEADNGDFVVCGTRKVSTTADYVPNDEMLTPSIEVITGATATAETAYIDYLYCAQQRFRASAASYI